MKKVALVGCSGYEQEKVQQAVDRAIELIGGYEKYIKPGMRVFIKPNLMRKSDPALSAVTHPSVIRAIAKRASELGAFVVVGDSPGGTYNRNVLAAVYRAAGLEAVAEETGAMLNYDCGERDIEMPGGKYLKNLKVISPILDADLIINVCKLKSHVMAVYSGAVKNLYGVIPGLLKAELHFRFQTIEEFSEMVVDICDYFCPGLNIIDGIVGMEGQGPGSGDSKQIGAVIASACPHSADLVATDLVGYRMEEIPMLDAAFKRGLFDGKAEVLGGNLEDMHVHDFVRAHGVGNHLLRNRVPSIFVRPLEKYFALRPQIRREQCEGCGACAGTCPAHAIKLVRGKANINRKNCIKCFCCMEFCPRKAILTKGSWIFRAAIRLTERGNGQEETAKECLK